MLGWFKKKFQRKNDAAPAVETPLEEIPEGAAEHGERSESPAPRPEPQPESEAAPEVAPGDKAALLEAEEQPAAGPAEEAEPPEAEKRSAAAGDGKGAASRPAPTVKPEAGKPTTVFARLSERLARTRESFTSRIDELFLGKKLIDADLFDDLEEIMITADLGVATTHEVLEYARKRVKRDALSDPQTLKALIKERIKSFITAHDQAAELVMPEHGPFVIMVVGVNGVGKTTTIGKITRKFLNSGQSVLLIAADTFRAAAVSQLKIWGERNNVRVIAHQEGADPSSVVYDGLAVARSKNYDVVLVDTAGRLHTRANLMEELKKIKRVMHRQLEGAPHEILLVIDATTGQNGISQATLFNEAVQVTGIALTKLDGTAKGGIVANIARELKMPIRFIGVGEKVEDLRDFDADEFIEALFESPSAPRLQP